MQHSAALAFKARKKHERRRAEGVRHLHIQSLQTPRARARPTRCVAVPETMCFLSNQQEMTRFLAVLNRCLEKRQSVFLDLSGVRVVQLNAVVVLLAIMVQFKSQGTGFGGNLPREESAMGTLRDSRFFDHLQGLYKPEPTYTLKGSSIYTHGRTRVDAEFNQELIAHAALTIWGEARRCKGVARTLIELMQNTYDHADVQQEGRKHWWLSVQHLPETKRVSFCFVDFGVGVFKSLESGDLRPIQRAFKQLKAICGGSGNDKLLERIFKGELHQTATGQRYRGKGLPGIYEVLQKGGLTDLTMITNDVYFSSQSGGAVPLRGFFPGTFVSWDMTQETESIK